MHVIVKIHVKILYVGLEKPPQILINLRITTFSRRLSIKRKHS